MVSPLGDALLVTISDEFTATKVVADLSMSSCLLASLISGPMPALPQETSGLPFMYSPILTFLKLQRSSKVFLTSIPCTYTSSPLDGMAWNFSWIVENQ